MGPDVSGLGGDMTACQHDMYTPTSEATEPDRSLPSLAVVMMVYTRPDQLGARLWQVVRVARRPG